MLADDDWTAGIKEKREKHDIDELRFRSNVRSMPFEGFPMDNGRASHLLNDWIDIDQPFIFGFSIGQLI
jgi:hypothetical protein